MKQRLWKEQSDGMTTKLNVCTWHAGASENGDSPVWDDDDDAALHAGIPLHHP